jgi:hypothetical protein
MDSRTRGQYNSVHPGRRLQDWHANLHGIMEYRDQQDFDHLSEALHKAGLSG